MIKFLVLFFLANSALAQSDTFWWACPDSAGVAPTHVSSPACSGTQCNGVRGETLSAEIQFTPRMNHNDLAVRVFAYILNVRVELPGEPPYDNVRILIKD
jgi:hypothetical protein